MAATQPELAQNTKSLLEQSRTHKAKTICFFNNKGGVGKTTLVANLSAYLALYCDQNILLVDADPECNLSQYLLSDSEFSKTYDAEDPQGTIYDIINPLSMGKGYSKDIPTQRIDNFAVDLIKGDPRLGLKEDWLAQDWRDAKAGGTRGLRTTFIFSELIERVSKKYNFIFFDIGPSLGAINRSVLLSADHFVIPMSIDIFSKWAIRNISQSLKVWQRELDNGLKPAEDPDEIKKWKDRQGVSLLGYVTQQHKEKAKSDGENRVVEAYNAIRTQLPSAINSTMAEFFRKKKFNPHLGDIKHLASLAPKSQTMHMPMVTVSAKGSYTSSRAQARVIYDRLANRFAENLS